MVERGGGGGSVTRRGFIGGSAAVLMVAAGCGREEPGGPAGRGGPESPSPWREGGWAVHDAVDASRRGEGVVRARVDGEWRSFSLADLPDRFVRWSLTERKARLAKLARVGFDPKDLAGPHNACVATYGGPGRDSAVSLNTAYKGMGFAPRRERLADACAMVGATRRELEAAGGADFGEVMARKTAFLGRLYADDHLFDRRLQISLELFAEPGWQTHTFLNMMANPIASMSFLAYPTFELRAVPQLIHPSNPDLDEWDRGLATWANAVHDFVHGGSGDRMACVYHVVEVFDDTPSDDAKGRRIA